MFHFVHYLTYLCSGNIIYLNDLIFDNNTIEYSSEITTTSVRIKGILIMKRAFQKYLYMLLVLPILLFSAGCSNLPFADNIALLTGSSDDMGFANELIPPAMAESIPKKEKEDNQANAKNAEAEEAVIRLSDNSAVLDIDAGGRTSPFVPYRERNLTYASMNFGDLPLPPSAGAPDEVLSSLITAKVTGILYDETSPSAIINVLDDDYLVKPGDKVETFEIASIKEDYVAIKTGSNIYRAKVGDIVDGDVYGTGIYNLGHKFAGTNNPSREEDILIVKTKKNSEKTGSANGDSTSVESIKDLSLPPVPKSMFPRFKLKTQAGEIPFPLGGSVTPEIDETN